MKRKTEREKFEEWMIRHWAGIHLRRAEDYDDEYEKSAAQVGWEVWQRFANNQATRESRSKKP